MALKEYKVYFSRTSVGKDGKPLHPHLVDAVKKHKSNLPVIETGGETFQMRDLTLVGTVWQGSFARLRDDAPHVVAANDQEHELSLDDGDRIIEKCYFLLRSSENLLVWQTNRSAGGMSRVQEYLSSLLDEMVVLPPIMNDAELDRVMAGQLYEVDFAYARPPTLTGKTPKWNQSAFDMMAGIDAAHAKFTLRAPRRGGLAESAKQMVKQLMKAQGAERIRVRLTDETDPIELFMAPLKDTIQVELLGRYPAAKHVFSELESAYDRQRINIPRPPGTSS